MASSVENGRVAKRDMIGNGPTSRQIALRSRGRYRRRCGHRLYRRVGCDGLAADPAADARGSALYPCRGARRCIPQLSAHRDGPAFSSAFSIAAFTFVLSSVLLAVYRIWRDSWRYRPGAGRRWVLREIAHTLMLPMAIFGFGVALVATAALFTTIQRGPHPDRILFELSIVTATCWAMVMVGGVWARRRKGTTARSLSRLR